MVSTYKWSWHTKFVGSAFAVEHPTTSLTPILINNAYYSLAAHCISGRGRIGIQLQAQIRNNGWNPNLISSISLYRWKDCRI